MKLSLHITKNYNSRDYLEPSHIRFAVIDLHRSKQYPANYLCILPRRLNPNLKIQNKFQTMFKEQSQAITKKLLKQALKTTDDQYIKNEIRERLKILNPKPKNLVKCSVCGEEFKARRYGYRLQKTCYGCLNKRRSNQT
jgi:formylmethanofuran dehydrogenase subunit E